MNTKWIEEAGHIPGFEQTMSLLNRIGSTPFLIKTTHPSDDSGVALLSRHFAERDTIDERQALVYGIGRLSARVFDLNQWYHEQGMNRRIVCIKKQVIKANGRKAYVTDYYRLEVTI
jgi:hypothetical protein